MKRMHNRFLNMPKILEKMLEDGTHDITLDRANYSEIENLTNAEYVVTSDGYIFQVILYENYHFRLLCLNNLQTDPDTGVLKTGEYYNFDIAMRENDIHVYLDYF